MQVQAGADPRSCAEFAAIQAEMAKLGHPACPDVDWGRVEQLCLTLFQRNGADLYSVAAYVLACSQRRGLEGIAQSMTLLEALAGEWSSVWPPMVSARVDILAWLFAQLQSLLRRLPLNGQSLPGLVHLNSDLLRLQQRLNHQVPVPLMSLRALHQQIDNLIHSLQQHSASSGSCTLTISCLELPALMPVTVWRAYPMPTIKPAKRRRFMGWYGAVILFGLALAVGWGAGANSQRFAAILDLQQVSPPAVQLDSLALFDAGSAELKPGSTKLLINALVDVKAQPGWLIVISGHSDDRGSPEQNLHLSNARALAVRGWMQRMGDIPDSCFAVQAIAAREPLASNETAAGRASNRRVDIRLMPQAGACEQHSMG